MRVFYKIILFFLVLILGFMGYLIVDKINYENYIENEYHFKISEMEYEIHFQNEEWAINGDGERLQIIKYKNLNTNIEQLNKLPIKETLPHNRIPKKFQNLKNGYYKCVIDKNDDRNFGILIIDTCNKEICIYNQVL